MSARHQLELPFPIVSADENGSAIPAAVWRESARQVTRELVQRARERWPRTSIPEPRLTFDLRGLSAGEACAETASIRYNDTLLLRHGQTFLDEIVPHEVAHLVVAARFRRRPRPHGPEWKSVMEFFGAAAERCHTFEVEPARRVRRFAYRCECAHPHLLTKRAHLRIRRGTAEYSCRQCRNVLVRVEG